MPGRFIEGALVTLDWLGAHGFGRLLQHTVVVLNAIQKTRSLVDCGAAENQFRKRVPDFFRIPYDPHLATGLAVDFSSLKRRTRNAVLDLAGGLAQHYPASRVRPRGEDSWKTWIETMRQVG